jgi:hypothetical protein
MQRIYSVTFVLRDGTKHDKVEKAKDHCKEKMYQILLKFGSQFTPVKVANWAQAVEDSTYDAAFYEYLEWRKEYDDLLNYEQDNDYDICEA